MNSQHGRPIGQQASHKICCGVMDWAFCFGKPSASSSPRVSSPTASASQPCNEPLAIAGAHRRTATAPGARRVWRHGHAEAAPIDCAVGTTASVASVTRRWRALASRPRLRPENSEAMKLAKLSVSSSSSAAFGKLASAATLTSEPASSSAAEPPEVHRAIFGASGYNQRATAIITTASNISAAPRRVSGCGISFCTNAWAA
mmetsp:Transcript_131504/g.420781  ORF Transcript_131504/g.420781 Transcript_131504/m.420781 type:complete len:202 (+) Transcript_131504:275-880(+)